MNYFFIFAPVMKKKEQIIEDWRITPREETHKPWVIDYIKSMYPDKVFDLSRWYLKIRWESIEKQANHVDALATYIDEYNMPPLLFDSYINILHAALQILRDLLFANTGFYLDINCDTEQYRENFKKLRFLKCPHDKEVISRLNKTFEKLHKLPTFDIKVPEAKKTKKAEKTWTDTERALHICISGYLRSDIRNEFMKEVGTVQDWEMKYAFAPFESEERTKCKNIYKDVRKYIREFALLFNSLSFLEKRLAYNFHGLIEEFRHDFIRDDLIDVWRNDMNGTREELIRKLEEDKVLRPWVRDYLVVEEGKREFLSIFEKADGSEELDPDKCYNPDNWLKVMTIAAVLQEYDEQHSTPSPVPPEPDKEADDELLLKLSLYFKDDDTAKRFLESARAMKNDTEIITLVKKYRDAKTCTDTSKKLWKILHDANIYIAQYRNWMNQLKL